MLKRISSTTGYTLIELALVLAVMAILTVVAIVGLAPALQKGRVRSAASVVASDLQFAQLMAARQRKPVVVLINSGLKQVIVRDRQSPTIFRTRELGADTEYQLDSLSASPSSAEIFPNGVARNMTMFTLGLNGYSKRVRLSRAGQIRILNAP